MTADILTNIHNKLTTFSKGPAPHRDLYSESYDKAAFLTAGRTRQDHAGVRVDGRALCGGAGL